ncbi:SigE family RNA polymerase sigma factor [Nocardioides seonyuensis]|uniref:SigE family RNA polymerase sigma factor n=1 Tax=Nocardioides seonyuensis TaxID=2518371 RepID=A0A4P7ICG1_9ACTN|nr:SigE family RNA polymerase sigma factor [Nocardioides seonyuensis]QBX54788.1 SigE family RNA polymerase sigma factor [Nocardioides seonyuensis]
MEERTSDRESFTAWATACRPRLLRTATFLTGDRGRAEDLVQEALTKVAQRWPRLRAGNPDAYARQILVRDNVSWWRRNRLELVSEVSDPGRTPSGDTGVERRLLLLDALRRLTERQRAVLVLRYFDDLSEAEIAVALGVSPGTVKSTAHLALRRLRELAPELSELLTLESP